MVSGSLLIFLVALDLGTGAGSCSQCQGSWTWEAALCRDTRVSLDRQERWSQGCSSCSPSCQDMSQFWHRGDSLSVVLTSELRCSALSKACVLRGRTRPTRLLRFWFRSGSQERPWGHQMCGCLHWNEASVSWLVINDSGSDGPGKTERDILGWGRQ